MSKFSLGLCSVSFRKHTPGQILEEMQKIGLDRIEWGSDIHAPADKPEVLKELAEMQKDYGVTCSSYGTYFKIGTNSLDELQDYIQAAKILGTQTLRIWAGEKNSEDFTKQEKEAFFKECRLLAKLAEEENVTLCTECHNKTYTNQFQSALELLTAVDSPHFQTYWQPNQFRDEAYNLASAAALAPFVKNVHLFHWLGKDKFPLADGLEIWKRYLKCFSGTETLLLEFMPDGRLESLKRETESARELQKASR